MSLIALVSSVVMGTRHLFTRRIFPTGLKRADPIERIGNTLKESINAYVSRHKLPLRMEYGVFGKGEHKQVSIMIVQGKEIICMILIAPNSQYACCFVETFARDYEGERFELHRADVKRALAKILAHFDQCCGSVTNIAA
jgi:hypothetical protein